MDFDKISLWLFLLLPSIYNSECQTLKKYQIPNNGGIDADENCFCFKSPGNHQKVPEILSPNKNNLERLVVYLYKDKLTNQVKLYVPNKEKQDHVPDLAFEVGDRLITVRDETVQNIFDSNVHSVNIDSDSGHNIKPTNEVSTDIIIDDYLENEDPENGPPYNTHHVSAPDYVKQFLESIQPSDPSSLEHGNLPLTEDLLPTNLDYDKSPYHMYDMPDAVPNYHEFDHKQHEKPDNNIIKIISQEVNIPNKMIYDDVYHETQPNQDLIYDPSQVVSDQVMSHKSQDPNDSIYNPNPVNLDHDYTYDPKLVHDVNNQVISHEVKDPESLINGHYDPNVIDKANTNQLIYDGQYDPNNELPFNINTDTPYGSSENMVPSETDLSDWDTPEYIDRDAETDTPNSQEQDHEQETKNSNSTPSQSIEESAKEEPNENSSSSLSKPLSEENVKYESIENIESIDEPNSSAGQSNTQEIKKNEPSKESSSIESPSIDMNNSGLQENVTCSLNTCTTKKSSSIDNISTEIKSNEENNEPIDDGSNGNDPSVYNIENNTTDSEHEIKINVNHYETFDKWFIQQMDRFRSYTEHDRAVNLLTIERYILKILHDNGMFVTSEGVLTDSYGTALDVNSLHLRPILIGNTMAFGSILNAKGTDLVMPANMAYLQAILVTNANPSMILGIIPIGKTVIPPSAVNAFSTILRPHVHKNDPRTPHSLISKYPNHYFETTKVNIKHVPGYKSRKPVVLHLSKHMPSRVRTLGKKRGKTVITVVKKRPIIVRSHHRLRQSPKVQVFGVGRGKSKFLTGDSADAVNKLIAALREGNDPMKSAEATNKLLSSLRKSTKSLDFTPENSNESSSDYSDDDIEGRIVGGSAATGSGAPLSAKGRIKDI